MILEHNLISDLSNTDLHSVLAHHGIKKAGQQNDNGSTYYFCPFCKGDRSPHFRVSKGERKGGIYDANQFSCHKQQITGYGAIELEAHLCGLTTIGADYLKVLNNLSYITQTPRPELDVNSRNGHVSWCSPQLDFSFEMMADFTPEGLQALGCQVNRIYEEKEGCRTAIECDNAPAFLYSFGPNFNKKRPSGSNFNTECLHREFGLYQIKSYTLPKQWKDGVEVSLKRESHALFPMFAFVYTESADKKKKAQWGQIIQPHWHDDDPTGQANFFFYTGGLNAHIVNRKLLGDMVCHHVFGGELPINAVKAVKTEEPLVLTTTKTIGDGKEQEEIEVDLEPEKIRVGNVLLCKDGINAMNAYYHLNSIREEHSYNPNVKNIFFHVAWMTDYNKDFDTYMFSQLNALATNKYLMFDIDNFGKKKAFQICKRFTDFRFALLPEVLKESPDMFIGGQHIPCRDIRSFFTKYAMTEDEKYGYEQNINLMFLSIFTSALPNQPLVYCEKRDKKTDKLIEYYYKLDISCLWQFMATEGYCREVNEGSSDRIGRYARIENCFVSYIDNKSILAAAASALIDFSQRKARPGTDDFRKMSNAILAAKDINEKTAVVLPVMDIDYSRGYGPKLDHFFYRNGVIKITPDSITFKKYDEIDFCVNTASILPFDIEMPCSEDDPPFFITLNPEIEKRRAEIAEMEGKPDEYSRSMIDKKKAELKKWEQNYKWILDFRGKEVKDWWKPLQLIRCFSNQNFEKEIELLRRGEKFSEEEERMIHGFMANLIYVLGRPLFRYKDEGKNYFPYITEANVHEEGSANGGSGKSSLVNTFMACGGKILQIDARNMDKEGDFHLKLARYIHHEHRVIHWEDYKKGMTLDPLYNFVTSGFQHRQRHKDEILVPMKESPGQVVTSNFMQKFKNTSESGRIIPTAFSNRFNRGDIEGQVEHRKISDVMPEFRLDPKDMDIVSRSQMAYLCAMAVQFCMNVDDKVFPPMEGLLYRSRSVSMGQNFMNWIEAFFSNSFVFNCPIDMDTIFNDYVEYCETSVDKKDKFALGTFKSKLNDYCKSVGYVMLPDVCFSSPTDRKRGYMRVKAWCKEVYFSDARVWREDEKVEFRVLKPSSKVLFFCKKGEEPKSNAEVKELCRAYYDRPDPDPVLDMDDNPVTGLTVEQEEKWNRYKNKVQGSPGNYYAPVAKVAEVTKTGEKKDGTEDLPF